MEINKRPVCLFEEDLEDKLKDKFEECVEEEFCEETELEKKDKTFRDILNLYLKEAYSHKLLTREEEIEIGKTIEENERIILSEVFQYYHQLAKFYKLLLHGFKKKRLSVLFKDLEDVENKDISQWFEKIKLQVEEFLDNFEENEKENYIEQIIETIYVYRPSRVLLDELSCEILEVCLRRKQYVDFCKKIKKKLNLEEDLENLSIFQLRSLIAKHVPRFSVCYEEIIKELKWFERFFKKSEEYFEKSLEEVYKSGEKIIQAYENIKKAKERLVKGNLRLIISIVRKYTNRLSLYPDLIQEGNVGLLKAAEKFDYRKGFKFSTYATWWIKQSITRYLAENTRIIRLPVHVLDTLYKITRIISTKFYQELGREPTIEELSKETGLSVEKLNYIFKIVKNPVSIESHVGEEEDTPLKEFIEDEKVAKPDEAFLNSHISKKIRELLTVLSPREEKIIRLRFGIGEERTYTLEEVGKKFGVTKERIRQIESLAIRKLKHPNRRKSLKNFLNY